MQLKISIQEQRPHVFLTILKGSINEATTSELENSLKPLMTDDTKAVILDMADVDYISSSGIRILLWARQTLNEMESNFSIVNMKPMIKKILDTMKLLPIFDIYSDMPEADKLIDQMINEELERGQK